MKITNYQISEAVTNTSEISNVSKIWATEAAVQSCS